MASVTPHGKKFRASIFRTTDTGVVRKTKVFATKPAARAWANKIEAELDADASGAIPADKTFGDLLDRYAREVSVTKAGARWEEVRITAAQRDPLTQVKLTALGPTHVAAWRDRRLASVSAGSVLREWTLLSNACTVAVKEWNWLKKNPFSQVRRPPDPEDRDRLFSCQEIEMIVSSLGWDDGLAPATVSARVAWALMWALETGMRAGEICALAPDDVTDTVAEVRGTRPGAKKSRAARRRVPLTRYAREIAAVMKTVATEDSLFGLRTSQVDALFRKARDRCGIGGLHFHDARGNATGMLSRHLDVLELARAIGHSDLRKLLIYYRKTAEDIASVLHGVAAG